jgi:Cu+-exporting ATPase
MCAELIEKEVKVIDGLINAQVNFASELLSIETQPPFNLQELKNLLQNLGYRLNDPNELTPESSLFKSRDFKQVVITLTLASAVMFFAMVIMNNLIQIILTSLLVSTTGRKYLYSLFKFKNNMNTLVGMGVLSSYLYSLYLYFTIHHAHLYLEGTAFIIAFTQLGHFLDNLAKKKARNNLGGLFKMQIKYAQKLIDGKTVNTPVKNLTKGEIIRILPGEKFPLDGIVIEGETHVDESMLTGESHALFKNKNQKVFAGSLNLEGSISVELTSEMHSTVVADIISYVENAQLNKAPIQQYADRIIKYFIPSIFAVAILSFVFWIFKTHDLNLAMNFAISVFVIACPCALGLAVPMAILISTSESAKSGLLISGGEALEKASSINTIIFDKTGTLTLGRPEVTNLVLFENKYHKTELIELASSALLYSNHPLAKAIIEFAHDQKLTPLDPDSFKSLTGLGVEATSQNKKIILGNLDLLTKEDIKHNIQENFYHENIGSYVFISIDRQLCGVFVINDSIKKDSIKTLLELRKLKFKTYMLTGDHEIVAKKIGNELGFSPDEIVFNAKPMDKSNFISTLKEKGNKVAMIGDGINDAPALIKADLSIAMSNGSDIAIDASDVSLLDGNLLLLPNLFKSSVHTMTVIKENLLLSALYNLLCIPLAAGAFYTSYNISLNPMWASLAMALSSFSVLLNSFRVKNI